MLLLALISLLLHLCPTIQEDSDQKDKPSFQKGRVCSGRKPNVVIFIADDLGIGDLGCYGNTTMKTPNIDSIGEQGVLFHHNLAPETICTPSRAAMLTGRYAIRSGMTSNASEARVVVSTAVSGGLPTNETTFGRLFQRQGYSTGFFGKWHLGIHKDGKDFHYHPLNHGFHYYYGMPLTNLGIFGPPETFGSNVNPKILPFFVLPSVPRRTLDIIFYTALCGFCATTFLPLPRRLKMICNIVSLLVVIWMGANIALHIFLIRVNGIVMRNKDVVQQPVDLAGLTKRVTEEVVDFVKKKEKEPFLAVVSYHKVHVALKTHADFRGKSAHGSYGDSVEELDWSVGKILSQLKASGVENNTFVYFTSDHGPGGYEEVNGERQGGWVGIFKGGKGNNYEGGIRVPTVARWPEIIRPKTVYNNPTSGMDLYPALAHIIGARLPEDRVIDGINFLPKITSVKESTEERYIFHYCGTALTAVTYIPSSSGHIWKLHYEIPEWPAGKDHFEENCARCFGEGIKKLKEPLLYDLSIDKSEDHPLPFTKTLYENVVKKIGMAVARHTSSVTYTERQLTRLKQRSSLSRIHCCNFPWCSCRESTI